MGLFEITMDDAINVVKQQLITSGDAKFSFAFPNPYFNNRVELEYILRAIETHISPIENVEAIIVFGSTVALPQIVETKYKTWVWFGETVIQKSLQYSRKPKDLDLLIVLKNGQSKNVTTSLSQRILYGDDYGCWFRNKESVNGLHLLATTANDFDKAVENNESVALSVLKNGVLLVGKFHRPLESPMTIDIRDNRMEIGRNLLAR